jgi:hypothetical protein
MLITTKDGEFFGWNLMFFGGIFLMLILYSMLMVLLGDFDLLQIPPNE